MRKVLTWLAFFGVLPAGCTSLPGLGGPHASVGWKVEIGSPSTLTVPATAVVQQGSGATAAVPVTAQLAAGSSSAAFAAAEPCSGAAAAARGPVLASQAGGCTLADVCSKLDTVISRLPAPAQKLPSGPAAKEE